MSYERGRYSDQEDNYGSRRQQDEPDEPRQERYVASQEDYGSGQQAYGGAGNNNYGGGVGYGGDDDLSGAARHAQQHAGDSGDSNLFSSVLNHLGQNKQNIGNQQLDEQGKYTTSLSLFVAKC